MSGKLMLKRIIAVVRLSLFFTWCWPLSNNASKFMKSCVKFYQYLSIFSGIGVIAPLIYAAVRHFDDPVYLVKLTCVICSTSHVVWNFAFQKANYHRIQYITFEMVHFSEMMKLREEAVIQRYIDKCIVFYAAFLPFFYLTALVIILGPLVMDQPFPTLAEYPFDVYRQPLRSIIYIHQSVITLQTASQICANIFMALLLWFASARFELLNEELRTVENVYDLIECIKKHHKLLEYATEVATVASPFTLVTIVSSMINIIIAFLMFFSKQSAPLIGQFFCLAVTGLVEVFMYAWPAENLININKNVAIAAYDMQWYNRSTEIWKYLQMIMLRSQKPVTVALPCVMPALSLSYYASYVSTILSYFTALRVMFSNDEN